MAGLLIVNPRAGSAAPDAAVLAAAAEERGVGLNVLAEGDDLAEVAREADADVLGIAGGDGSAAALAAVCVESGRPLVCVPYGTRNHFARDLGLERDDPVAALAGFEADAQERRVDVGRANGRVFLNNVSLGLYAGLVHDRERRRRRREAFARLKALRRLAVEREAVSIAIDGAPVASRLVLVANNAYDPPRAFSLGARERLDEGLLCLYVASGALPPAWEERRAERLLVESATGALRAAVDGEPAELSSPLRLAVEPGALRVRLPAARDRGE